MSTQVLPAEIQGPAAPVDHRRSRGVTRPLRGQRSLGPGSAAASPLPSGPVDVLSAGSLQDLLQQQVGPAFQQATGYTLNDTSMGSDAIASGIKGGTLQGDVFISASPAVNKTLEGSANGNWVSWYASFGSSPLVLGYNPSSKFAGDLRTKPWYDVIDQPGFLIGRTDPATDPKGVLAVTALDQAAKAHDIPALKAIAIVDVERLPRDLARRAAPGRAARCRVLLRRRGGRGRHQDGSALRNEARRRLHLDRSQPCPARSGRPRLRGLPSWARTDRGSSRRTASWRSPHPKSAGNPRCPRT